MPSTRQRRALLCLLPLLPQWVQAGVIQEYHYQPDAVYAVRTGQGIATQIELEADEQVRDFGTGQSGGWELVRRDQVFYLKPRHAQAATNMHIRTDRRSYLLELQVLGQGTLTPAQARRQGVHYKVRFRYPATTSERSQAAVDETAARHEAYSYAASADAVWLRPEHVSDDGRFTYIDLSPEMSLHGGLPAVFGRQQQDGEDFLINSSYQQGRITVHGVYPYLVLRHGQQVLALRRE